MEASILDDEEEERRGGGDFSSGNKKVKRWKSMSMYYVYGVTVTAVLR